MAKVYIMSYVPLLFFIHLFPNPILFLHIDVHEVQKLILRLKRNMGLELGIGNGHY